MEDNNNDGQQPQEQGPPQVPLLQIQDIDDWLRFNGLRSADDEPPDAPEYNSFMSSLNQSEIKARYEAGVEYQEKIHATIFQDDLQKEEKKEVSRQRMLHLWKDEEMDIVTLQKTFSVPLCQLAAECETIYILASSRRYNYGKETSKSNDDDEPQQPTPVTKVSLSLEDYSTSAVHEFITLALKQKPLSDISDQHVVDCCHIGHYLQCARILEGTTEILLQHVDSDNCYALCQMSDQLQLPDLFERALFHMLKSLDDLESQEAYDEFSSELKDRIAGIRTIFTSHSVGGGSDNSSDGSDADGGPRSMKRPLYFTSLEEYISIFAETVQYHRERLEEAKEQNSQARHYSAYAQSKIEKQELRVLTLEAMLQEQKRLFGRKHKKVNEHSATIQ